MTSPYSSLNALNEKIYNQLIRIVPYKARLKAEYYRELRSIHDSGVNRTILQDRFHRFRAGLKQVIGNSGFYRTLYGDHGIRIEHIRSFQDLRTLPMITRSMLQENWKAVIPAGVRPKRFFYSTGTTGTPLKIPVTDAFLQREIALIHYFFRYTGFNPESFRLEFRHNGLKKDWEVDYINRTVRLHENPENIHFAGLFKFLSRSDIKHVSGYPSLIHRFARYAFDKGLVHGLERIKGVFLFSEQAYFRQFEDISRAFPNALLLSHYGQAEGAVTAVSMDRGRSYQFLQRHGFTEFEEGSIIATSFSNAAFPLIRYNTADTVENPVLDPSTGELLRGSVQGRREDFPKRPDGSKVSPAKLTFSFKTLEFIDKIKILQHVNLDIQICYSGARVLSAAEENKVIREFKGIFGNDIRIFTSFMDGPFFDTNGKYKWVECM